MIRLHQAFPRLLQRVSCLPSGVAEAAVRNAPPPPAADTPRIGLAQYQRDLYQALWDRAPSLRGTGIGTKQLTALISAASHEDPQAAAAESMKSDSGAAQTAFVFIGEALRMFGRVLTGPMSAMSAGVESESDAHQRLWTLLVYVVVVLLVLRRSKLVVRILRNGLIVLAMRTAYSSWKQANRSRL